MKTGLETINLLGEWNKAIPWRILSALVMQTTAFCDGLAMPWMGRYPDLIEVRYDGSIRDLLTFLGTLAQDGLQWRPSCK